MPALPIITRVEGNRGGGGGGSLGGNHYHNSDETARADTLYELFLNECIYEAYLDVYLYIWSISRCISMYMRIWGVYLCLMMRSFQWYIHVMRLWIIKGENWGGNLVLIRNNVAWEKSNIFFPSVFFNRHEPWWAIFIVRKIWVNQ